VQEYVKNKVGSKANIYVGNTFEMCITEQDPRETYTYLDTEESYDMQHKNGKEKLKKEYLRRFRLVFGTKLSAMNKIQATGSLAVTVLRYTFGFVNWHQEELQKLDRKTRKLLTIHEEHCPKVDVNRLYVPRNREEGA